MMTDGIYLILFQTKTLGAELNEAILTSNHNLCKYIKWDFPECSLHGLVNVIIFSIIFRLPHQLLLESKKV